MNRNQSVIIVLIDDNLEHASIAKQNLARERPGDAVIHFADGMQAVEFLLACEGQQVLVMLDVHTPLFDGYRVLHAIKRHHRMRRIPVIVFTTVDDQVEALRCYNAGCNLYITKPAAPADWAETIRRLGSVLSVMAIPA